MKVAKQAAAKHSVQAFELYDAARRMRNIALTLYAIDEPEAGEKLRDLASEIDGKRRRLMKRNEPISRS